MTTFEYWSLWLYVKGRRMLRLILGARCSQCAKHFWRGYSEHECSEACFERWLPF